MSASNAAHTIFPIDPLSRQARTDVLSKTHVLASSSKLGWSGLSVEVGRSEECEADGLVMPGNHLGMNIGPEAVPVEVKGVHGFQRVVVPPLGLWIQPCNTPFTRKRGHPLLYGAVQVSPSRSRHILGADINFRPADGLLDERLAAIIRLLLLEVCAVDTCGRLYVESLEIALLSRLAQRCRTQSPSGSLGALRLKLVNQYIEDQIDEPLRIDDMAAVAGVSPAHFAREFKRATGESPHAFVMGRRVERARELLVSGGSLADVAAQCGFTDQAHLSRLFKRRLGVGPSAFVRRRAR